MNLPFLVDVAIGLVLIYLILSVLASEIQEIFSTILQWRAAHLKKSIEILLMGDASVNLGKYNTRKDDYTTPEGIAAVIVNVLVDKLHLREIDPAVRREAENRITEKLKEKIAPEDEFTREEAVEEITKRIAERSEVAEIKINSHALEDEVLAVVRTTPDPQQISQKIVALPRLTQLSQAAKTEIAAIIDSQVQKITKTKEEKILQILNDVNNRLQLGVNPQIKEDVEQTIAAVLLTAQTKAVVNTIYNDPLIQNISQSSKEGIEAVVRKATRIVTTAGRRNVTLDQGSEPSYIPSETFATTLLETLRIPQFSRQLTALNLRILTQDEIFSQIEELIDHYQFGSEDQSLNHQLETHLYELKGKIDLLIVAFRDEKLSLTLAVNLLRGDLAEFISKTEAQLSSITDPANSDSDSNQKARTDLINQLKALQQSIFYADEKLTYSNTDEIIHQLQPSLGQVMDIFVGTAAETRRKYETLKADPKILEDYSKLKATARGIVRQMPPPVRKSLDALSRRAEINLDRAAVQTKSVQEELKQFKLEIQNWFDRSMDRASGVYKRNAKGVAFMIGLALALVGNVDTLHITSQLSTDSTLRQILVQQAESIVAECSVSPTAPTSQPAPPQPSPSPVPPPPVPESAVPSPGAFLRLEQPAFAQTPPPPSVAPESNGQVTPTPTAVEADSFDPNTCIRNTVNNETALPIGWSQANRSKQWGSSQTTLPAADRADIMHIWHVILGFLQRLLGWVISGIAISMGASFWFDLLGKLVNVRNTGKRPTGKAD